MRYLFRSDGYLLHRDGIPATVSAGVHRFFLAELADRLRTPVPHIKQRRTTV